jgi:hypothetical protein
MLGVLKKVDSTFRIRQSRKYTAVNKDGFEVGIIRRERAGDDPHPIKLSDEDEDFWVVQARRANVLLDSPGFSAVIVATNGTMARMNTVHPATFVAFKRWRWPIKPGAKPSNAAGMCCKRMRCRPCWTSICRRFDAKQLSLIYSPREVV